MESPSLNSPERMRRRWLVLGEFAKYAFCGLKRKRRDFERSVLKYVSIKIPALTHSGRKSRVCVNQPDRLSPNCKATQHGGDFCFLARKNDFFMQGVYTYGTRPE